jgi:hypothetical protein
MRSPRQIDDETRGRLRRFRPFGDGTEPGPPPEGERVPVDHGVGLERYDEDEDGIRQSA